MNPLNPHVSSPTKHHVVRDELAGLHEHLRLLAELGAGLDGGAQHIPGGEVHHPVALVDGLALRPLAWGDSSRSARGAVGG